MVQVGRFIGICMLLFTMGCQEVIDLELEEGPIRLVIEASIQWEKGTAGNEQSINLRTSSPYYDNTVDTSVSGAQVTVSDLDTGEVFDFTDRGDGSYTTSNFAPYIGNRYRLQVLYQGERYQAEETLMSVVNIDAVYQSSERGFDTDVLEVNVDYTDPADETNYYLFQLEDTKSVVPILEAEKDEFVNGNEVSWYHESLDDEDTDVDERYMPGDEVSIEINGISEAYYNYMVILTNQLGSGGPFATTPVALRGNCVNLDNPDNYAFGYFRLNQVVRTPYTFD